MNTHPNHLPSDEDRGLSNMNSGGCRNDSEISSNGSPSLMPGMELLAKLSKEIGDFDKEIREQLAARLRRQAANGLPGQTASDKGASHRDAGRGTAEEGGFESYRVKPGDEMPNLLGELAEPGSVFRMNTLLSPGFPLGPVGPYLSKSGAVSPQRQASLAFALLGSGDQSLVLPASQKKEAGAAGDASRHPSRVRWIQAVKPQDGTVPGIPPDALMVTGIDQPRSGKGTGPWMLDHLGLPESVTADLQHAILSLKPAHQAFAMAAISSPTLERAFIEVMPSVRAGAVAHPLAVGLVALEQVQATGLSQDQVSLVRLACLIADLGMLPVARVRTRIPAAANEPADLSAKGGGRSAERQAHPMTLIKLRRILARFIEAMKPAQDSRLPNLIDDMSAGLIQDGRTMINEGIWLQQLLSDAVLLEYRLDSRHGPLSKSPIHPEFSAMARAFSDAIQLARQEANAGLSHGRKEWVLLPVQGQECGRQISSDLNWIQPTRAANDEMTDAAPADGASDAAAISPSQLDQQASVEPLDSHTPAGVDATMGNTEGTDDDQGPLFESLPVGLDREAIRIPDHERRAYEDRSIPWPRPSLSWAAGMLDGDGCVAIVRQTYPDRNANYRLVVQVTQNCLQTLQHFRSCVGVTAPIHEVKRRIGHNRQVYTLNYAGPKALLVLQRLRAYLVRKRPEAEVALSFIEKGQVGRRFGPRGVPPQLEAIRISHYNKLRALK